MNIRDLTVAVPLVVLVAIPILVLVFGISAAKVGAAMAVNLGVADDLGKAKRVTTCLIIAFLLAIVITIAQSTSTAISAHPRRTHTQAFLQATSMALSSYRDEYGEYPSPLKEPVYLKVDGHDYEAGPALMLYQALTGDGDDKILTLKEPHLASDGVVKGDEITRVFVKNMPKEMWCKTEVGYLLTDGFGHPVQFTNAGADCVNANYDLWSYGEASPQPHPDKATKQDEMLRRGWITNW